MIDTKNIGGVYTLTNPYADLSPIYASGQQGVRTDTKRL